MSHHWASLTADERARWRELYAEWTRQGYPDATASRESYITVWRERDR